MERAVNEKVCRVVFKRDALFGGFVKADAARQNYIAEQQFWTSNICLG